MNSVQAVLSFVEWLLRVASILTGVVIGTPFYVLSLVLTMVYRMIVRGWQDAHAYVKDAE